MAINLSQQPRKLVKKQSFPKINMPQNSDFEAEESSTSQNSQELANQQHVYNLEEKLTSCYTIQ